MQKLKANSLNRTANLTQKVLFEANIVLDIKCNATRRTHSTIYSAYISGKANSTKTESTKAKQLLSK